MNVLTESFTRRMPGVPGSVYIIHFEEPFHHARHYIGWAKDSNVDARADKHLKGNGARLLKAVSASGIKWHIVRVFHNVDRNFERWLKDQHRTADFCPHCSDNPRKIRST